MDSNIVVILQDKEAAMRLIDADELIVDMKIGFSTFPSAPQFGTMCSQYGVTIRQIENAPTIEAVPKDFHDKTCEAMAKRHTEEIQRLMPKRGEWIAKTENYHSHWVCSECGGWALLEYNEQMCLSNFCPNCGSRMRGGKDD